MTTYHFSIGYIGGSRSDFANCWEILKQEARKICDNPQDIIAEARRLGCPENCSGGCCPLETYADNYKEPFDLLGGVSHGHPITIRLAVDEDDENQIIQWASTDSPDGPKYHVRRAFARLLIEAMHKQSIEVNLRVSSND